MKGICRNLVSGKAVAMGKEGRKVKYTRSVIRESFLALMQEKPIQKITIAELCEKADIHRGTFYQHYHDIYELRDCVEEELLEKFRSLRGAIEGSMTSQTREILKAILEDKELCKALFGINCEPVFIGKVTEICRQGCYGIYQRAGINEQEFGFIFSYYTSGCMGIIRHWIAGGCEQPTEEVLSYIDRLPCVGIDELLAR